MITDQIGLNSVVLALLNALFTERDLGQMLTLRGARPCVTKFNYICFKVSCYAQETMIYSRISQCQYCARSAFSRFSVLSAILRTNLDRYKSSAFDHVLVL